MGILHIPGGGGNAISDQNSFDQKLHFKKFEIFIQGLKVLNSLKKAFQNLQTIKIFLTMLSALNRVYEYYCPEINIIIIGC